MSDFNADFEAAKAAFGNRNYAEVPTLLMPHTKNGKNPEAFAQVTAWLMDYALHEPEHVHDGIETAKIRRNATILLRILTPAEISVGEMMLEKARTGTRGERFRAVDALMSLIGFGFNASKLIPGIANLFVEPNCCMTQGTVWMALDFYVQLGGDSTRVLGMTFAQLDSLPRRRKPNVLVYTRDLCLVCTPEAAEIGLPEGPIRKYVEIHAKLKALQSSGNAATNKEFPGLAHNAIRTYSKIVDARTKNPDFFSRVEAAAGARIRADPLYKEFLAATKAAQRRKRQECAILGCTGMNRGDGKPSARCRI